MSITSTYVGLVLLIVLMPIPTLAGQWIVKLQAEKMEKVCDEIYDINFNSRESHHLDGRANSSSHGRQVRSKPRVVHDINGSPLVLNVLRMIKLFAWEPRMLEKLIQKRDEELKKMRLMRFLEIALFSMNDLIPMASSIGTLGVYVSAFFESDIWAR